MALGGLLAQVQALFPSWLETELRHGVAAFGGGVLMVAVALELVPQGIEKVGSALLVGLCLGLGGLVFCLLDGWIQKARGSAANLFAMVADFIPESIALGAGFATGERTGMVLALLIALQNIPEGFNSYRELTSGNFTLSPRKTIGIFCAMAMFGPIAGGLGFIFLVDLPVVIGAISLFASGGILYLVFQDIAPQAALKNKHWPALGAVLGFIVGAVAQVLIGS